MLLGRYTESQANNLLRPCRPIVVWASLSSPNRLSFPEISRRSTYWDRVPPDGRTLIKGTRMIVCSLVDPSSLR